MSDDLDPIAQTPRRAIAEWEPIAGVLLAWPHNRETWPGRFEPIPSFFARWAKRIAETTPVHILADGPHISECRNAFGGSLPSQISIIPIGTNDCWVRDYGPTWAYDSTTDRVMGVDWKFNAWGGKYPPWDQDDSAAASICEALQIPREPGGLCLEGGAMEFDGRGRMITTGCLLTKTRNPNHDKQRIAQVLYQRLGIHEIVWIENATMEGDDTDGHVDQLARFIDPQNLVVASCDDPSDANFGPLQDVYRQLKLWGTSTDTNSTNPSVEVHPLPIPPIRRIHGQRVPESYCNFLRLGSERLMMPTFGATTDDIAAGILRDLSGAEVVRIDCRDLAWGLGALHCASREIPKPLA